MHTEWLILGDSAQVTGGKLYLLGGGWDVLTVNTPLPVQQRCAIAVAFRVPWTETNRPHGVEIVVEHEDGAQLFHFGAQVEVGQGASPPGHEQRTQFALELTLELAAFGTYVMRARVDGLEDRRVPFRVVPGPQLA